MDFKDRTVLITGAATGIGRSLAVAFASEGADLALLDIDERRTVQTAELVRERGRQAAFYRADASDRASLEQAIAAAWSAQGPIALACANAGVMTMAPLLDMDDRDLDWLMRVNLYGVLDTARAYVAHLRKAGSTGHLMLTGSENSFAVPHALRRAGVGVYGITKHAVLQMAETLRYELAAEGIGVSILLPGPAGSMIAVAGRNRPEAFGGPVEGLGFDPSLFDPDIEMPPLISCDAVARIAVECLRAGRFMIPTHSHILDYARARLEELAEATAATALEPGS
jgi:NAD(P)-dependent dehydrogenase (short-subunit alcohol dehydrogenase family)